MIMHNQDKAPLAQAELSFPLAVPESKKVIHRVQDPIAENLSLAGGKIRPFYRRFRLLFLGDDARNEFIAFPKFDRLARSQPGLEAASVAQLADVHRWHVLYCDT